MEHPLRRALAAAGLSVNEVADQLHVDPKTVKRWCGGRVPYRRNRFALSKLIGWPEHDLWPDLAPIASQFGVADQIRIVRLGDPAVSHGAIYRLFEHAEQTIGMLAVGGFFREQEEIWTRLLYRKAYCDGVKVRILLNKLEPRLSPWADLHDIIRFLDDGKPYSSICYADDRLLVSPSAYGVPFEGSLALSMRRFSEGDIASMYLASFECLWNESTP